MASPWQDEHEVVDLAPPPTTRDITLEGGSVRNLLDAPTREVERWTTLISHQIHHCNENRQVAIHFALTMSEEHKQLADARTPMCSWNGRLTV